MTTLAPPDMAAIARYIKLFADDIGPTGEMADQLRRLVAVCERQSKLLAECSSTLEMWADVAPAVSLRADIDKALALTRERE